MIFATRVGSYSQVPQQPVRLFIVVRRDASSATEKDRTNDLLTAEHESESCIFLDRICTRIAPIKM
ncbi:hypothetical protein C7W93_17710 [Glaciimonas sp. PCH181]|nr:hypothetical protein C7W93_17710 [Glaciimonas sp. PCH181]